MLRINILATQFYVTQGFYADPRSVANDVITWRILGPNVHWVFRSPDSVRSITVFGIQKKLAKICALAHRSFLNPLVIFSHVYEVLHPIQIERRKLSRRK